MNWFRLNDFLKDMRMMLQTGLGITQHIGTFKTGTLGKWLIDPFVHTKSKFKIESLPLLLDSSAIVSESLTLFA